MSAPTVGRGRGLRHGPGRGHADKDRPVIFVLVERGGPRVIEAGASIDQATLPSYLKLHQFRRNERERPDWEQACLLLAALMGQGPSPRCLVTPGWVHNRDECRGWRPPRESVAETAPALAA